MRHDVGVVVPGDVGSECELDHSHAALGKPASKQTAFGKTSKRPPSDFRECWFGPDAIQIQCRLVFAMNVERFGRLELHEKGKFETADPRLERCLPLKVA